MSIRGRKSAAFGDWLRAPENAVGRKPASGRGFHENHKESLKFTKKKAESTKGKK
jgi:hypothetical protein